MSNYTEKSPTNVNPSRSSNYIFNVKILPNTNYFCNKVNLPGLSLGVSVQASPFVEIIRPGDKVTFDSLTINFNVQEDLSNWREIFDWMIALGFPESFNQYKDWQERKDGREIRTYSDATLTILSNNKNKLLEVELQNIFPVSLSEISFDSTNPSEEVLTATATFSIMQYKFL